MDRSPESGARDAMDDQMAEIMGFTGFSSFKKRKISRDDAGSASGSAAASVDANSTPAEPSNGFHTQPLTHQYSAAPASGLSTAAHASRTNIPPAINTATPSAHSPGSTSEAPKSAFPTGVPVEIFDRLTWKELEAYRKGVKNESGDLAWFLPSFIEDPWAKLEGAIGRE